MTPTEIKASSTADLVALYNRLAGKNIKKFQDRATAERRVLELVKTKGNVTSVKPIEQDGKLGLEIKTVVQAGTGTPKRTGLPGPNSHYAGKRIKLVAKTNPRREGTAGWKSFSIMRDGMTYEEYRLKGGRSNDLAWDVAHGYVEMV